MTSNTKETTREFFVEYDLTRFPKFLDSFQQSEFWKSMEVTVEASPWHREANVAVHTMMALDQAPKWYPPEMREISTTTGTGETSNMIVNIVHESDPHARRHIILTKLAVLFHDTGKPPMEEVKENAERGVYRSYANHEQRSARIFESYVMDNWDEWFRGWITPEDVFAVSWIIEHHLPYGLKNENKIVALVESLMGLPSLRDISIFFNALRADGYGRTSDKWDDNVANLEAWVADMTDRINKHIPAYTKKVMEAGKLEKEVVFLIGPPGVGKSSARILFEDYSVFNLDDLRVQYYRDNHPDAADEDVKEQYSKAFFYATENEALFKAYSMAKAVELFSTKSKVLIDNTNVSIKARRQYLDLAKQQKFFTTAVYIPASLRLLKERNESRPDKKLPLGALDNLHYAVALPSRGGEFHSVVIASSNYGQ